ncbi:MAG: ferredoxin reductase family protein [Bryobacteraceae bacterium]
MPLFVRGALWLGLYAHLVLLPLIVAGHAMPLGVACGYLGFTIMALEFSLISKVHSVSSAFGQDALQRFHRMMGLVATLLIAIHVALMLRAGYPFAWVNPIDAESPWAMRAGAVAMWAVFLLILLSLCRRLLAIPYQWWQFTHGLLADAAILLGLAHLILFGGFAAAAPMRVVLAGYAALTVGMRLWFKVAKPLRLWSRPWTLVANIAELGDSRTLVLEPAGHRGFVFEPGQFAWLNTGRTPFHRDRHPISMSSPAYDEPGHPVAFTIKDFGDWSGQVVPTLEPGARIWVDGPYGVFSPDRDEGPAFVFIGGGAGITPLYSMCRTMALREDRRPVLLLFGGRDAASLTFRSQLDELSTQMNLRVIYVLEHPPANWTGETGYIDAALLRRYLPPRYQRCQYFVCGPEAMMDAIEQVLPAIGVPRSRVHTERFVII